MEYTIDTIHRADGQFIPATCRVIYAPMLTVLTADLHSNIGDQAFPQCIFDHWEIINKDPFDDSTEIRQIINDIRKPKGLKGDIPSLNDHYDKL
ncbi:unnamed protein product [Rotaria sordida]|uniref:Elongation factor 2 n=2 Tax=Rotaria sordida TaxID=392033 RepID=A0A814X8T1_9BILA|nr:unnamed protein product [Rotaria sordida]